MSLMSFCLPEHPDDEAAFVFFRGCLDAGDLAADALGIGDDQTFWQCENADGATQQGKIPLIAATVQPDHATGLTVLWRIEFGHFTVKIAEQPLEDFRQFLHRPVTHADEEVVAADMAEKAVAGEK